MSEYVARLFAGAMIGWFCAFVAVLVYWINGEAIESGQQFADPLAPCIFVGFLFGTLPGMIVAGITTRRW